MHTGVSSSWVVWHVCLERYTRVLMKASLEFPIHFLKIYRCPGHSPQGWYRAPAASVVEVSRISRGGDTPEARRAIPYAVSQRAAQPFRGPAAVRPSQRPV